MKPFRISENWIYYAHQPASDAGQPLAVELMGLPVVRGQTIVPGDRRDLIEEIASVAELYIGGPVGDNNPQAGRTYARANRFLKEQQS
tara:strand:+ start:116 stop:379 length:264 start_codon:yes stop_codon:yes gene_type:complete